MKGGECLKNDKKVNNISFLGKLILFGRAAKKWLSEFRPIHSLIEKQKKLSHYSGARSFEESKISFFFGFARIFAVILLLRFLITMLIFGSGVFSYEKMYYMFKDIAYIKSYAEGEPDELSYSSPVQNQIYTDFKNGLLVASDSELKFFTSTGRVTLNEGSEFTNPHVVCSSSTALIYDQGRREYSIYNSFVKLYSEKTEYQISSADMAADGSYLIVTRSKLFNSVVRIYDQTYEKIGEYSKNDTVISASMSDNGRYAAILSLSVRGGKSSILLEVIDTKKSKIIAQNNIEGHMPYMCEFMPNDKIAVFTDEGFTVTDKKADIQYEYTYPSKVENIDINDNGFVILYSKTEVTGEKVFEVYDSNGKKTFAKDLSGNVRSIRLGDGYVYVLKSNEVIRISTSLGTESKKVSSAENMQLIAFDNGKVCLCSQNAAEYILFD